MYTKNAESQRTSQRGDTAGSVATAETVVTLNVAVIPQYLFPLASLPWHILTYSQLCTACSRIFSPRATAALRLSAFPCSSSRPLRKGTKPMRGRGQKTSRCTLASISWRWNSLEWWAIGTPSYLRVRLRKEGGAERGRDMVMVMVMVAVVVADVGAWLWLSAG